MSDRAPVIGISTNHVNEAGRVDLSMKYIESIRRAGGIPLLIAPGETRLDQLLEQLDGVILSGGGDVDPARYDAVRHEAVERANHARDELELTLARRTIEADKPMLCICRGVQVLNVALGGSLVQHIPDALETDMPHRYDMVGADKEYQRHAVSVSAESRLAKIMTSDTVNTASWHHQSLERVAEGLEVVAVAEDGIIEAVEMKGKPVFGVQWHPEVTAAEDETQQNLFNEIVRLAREKMA